MDAEAEYSSVEIRVRYSETDRMGYCYYGNYAQYLEVGRVEAMREKGISYRDLENQGIGLPVTHYAIDYKHPAQYDDVLEVRTYIRSCVGTRLSFDYEVVNTEGRLVCNAVTVLVFVNLKNGRPVKPPAEVLKTLSLGV